MKYINKFIQLEHFKMEDYSYFYCDYKTVLKLLKKNNYMASLDLKDAYFLISVHEEHRKYLRFEWDN